MEWRDFFKYGGSGGAAVVFIFLISYYNLSFKSSLLISILIFVIFEVIRWLIFRKKKR